MQNHHSKLHPQRRGTAHRMFQLERPSYIFTINLLILNLFKLWTTPIKMCLHFPVDGSLFTHKALSESRSQNTLSGNVVNALVDKSL